MNPSELYSTLNRELDSIKEAKTFKYEVPLESQQGGDVMVGGRWVVRDGRHPGEDRALRRYRAAIAGL